MTDTMMALKRYGLKKSDFRIVRLQNAKLGIMGDTHVTYNGQTYSFQGISGFGTSSESKNRKLQLDDAMDRFLSMVHAIR